MGISILGFFLYCLFVIFFCFIQLIFLKMCIAEIKVSNRPLFGCNFIFFNGIVKLTFFLVGNA